MIETFDKLRNLFLYLALGSAVAPAMVGAFISGSSGPDLRPVRDIALCSWARRFSKVAGHSFQVPMPNSTLLLM